MSGARHESPFRGVPSRGSVRLPRTDDVRHPAAWPLYRGRRMAQRIIRMRYDVRVTAGEHVPATGPVIIASNHVGVADGPLLAIFGPRPVHALTKAEMFVGFTGRFLTFAGQLELHRDFTDPRATKQALKVLDAGHALGIYPEGSRGDGELRRFARGAAYFALVSGAPVVPVYMFGTRLPGEGVATLPPKGSRIDLVFAPAFHVPAQPWPRTREQVGHVTKLLQEHMQVHLDDVRASTGLELPGPLPSM